MEDLAAGIDFVRIGASNDARINRENDTSRKSPHQFISISGDGMILERAPTSVLSDRRKFLDGKFSFGEN